MKNVWKDLVKIDVGDKIEKKGRFSYLSWSWAWQEVKERYPDATFEVHEDVVYPDNTVEVRVSVTIEGLTHMMWLPVMNNSNKAIQNPNARDISDARMRCWVKAIALHGLGLYIYAGEGVPQADNQEQPQMAPPPAPAPAQDNGGEQYTNERIQEIQSIQKLEELGQWEEYFSSGLDRLNEERPDLYAKIEHEFNKRKAML